MGLFVSGGTFHIDGVSSDTWRAYCNSWSYTATPNVRSNLIDIPGRVGKRNAGSELSSGLLTLNLTFVGNTAAANVRKDMLDNAHLFSAAIDPRLGTHVLVLDDDYPGWQLNVIPNGAVTLTPNLITGAMSVPFEAPDPFWYNITGKSTVVTAVSGTPYHLDNAGLAETPLVLTIKPLTTGVTGPATITINGVVFTYAANLLVTDTLVIDTGNFTVTKNGVNDIANWTGDFPTLPAGLAQAVTWACANGAQVRITNVYTERKL